jgi:hypothetical protein
MNCEHCKKEIVGRGVVGPAGHVHQECYPEACRILEAERHERWKRDSLALFESGMAAYREIESKANAPDPAVVKRARLSERLSMACFVVQAYCDALNAPDTMSGTLAGEVTVKLDEEVRRIMDLRAEQLAMDTTP